jgi:hypothetical protein
MIKVNHYRYDKKRWRAGQIFFQGRLRGGTILTTDGHRWTQMETEDGRLKMAAIRYTWVYQVLFPLIRRRTSASQSDTFSLGEKGRSGAP